MKIGLDEMRDELCFMLPEYPNIGIGIAYYEELPKPYIGIAIKIGGELLVSECASKTFAEMWLVLHNDIVRHFNKESQDGS
jgi:hypothetical protein